MTSGPKEEEGSRCVCGHGLDISFSIHVKARIHPIALHSVHIVPEGFAACPVCGFRNLVLRLPQKFFDKIIRDIGGENELGSVGSERGVEEGFGD